MKVKFLNALGETNELTLPKLTEEQLNATFGKGNWEVLESAGADALTSKEKMDRLGIDEADRAEYLAIVSRGMAFRDDIQNFLESKGICYTVDGIKTSYTVGSGIYIQNPDKPSAAVIEKKKKEATK